MLRDSAETAVDSEVREQRVGTGRVGEGVVRTVVTPTLTGEPAWLGRRLDVEGLTLWGDHSGCRVENRTLGIPAREVVVINWAEDDVALTTAV